MALTETPPPLLVLPEAETLAEAVASAVRDGVTRRELVPGTTYSVYQMADLLGVSRSPVREALLRLAEAGLVEIERNRGFRVVLPTARDLEEIFEIRAALEPAAAARAARAAASDGRATEAEGHLAAMRSAADAADERAFWAADRALHRALLIAAGNRRAATIVEDLRATTALLGPPTTATGRSLHRIAEEHAPIVAAVVAGDPGAAEATMRDHLDHTRRLLVASLPTCQQSP